MKRFYIERTEGREINIVDCRNPIGDKIIAEVYDMDLAEAILEVVQNNPKPYITQRHDG